MKNLAIATTLVGLGLYVTPVMAQQQSYGIIGVYGGTGTVSATIERDSTNNANDKRQTIDSIKSMAGGYFGIEHEGVWRYYLSYDQTGDESSLSTDRFMMNADLFMSQYSYKKLIPFIGMGVGYAYNTYQLDSFKTNQDNGLVAGRAGVSYQFAKKHKLELMYEYSYMVTNGHEGDTIYGVVGSYQQDSIVNQYASQWKIAYQFSF
jgi:hypothetical protein